MQKEEIGKEIKRGNKKSLIFKIFFFVFLALFLVFLSFFYIFKGNIGGNIEGDISCKLKGGSIWKIYEYSPPIHACIIKASDYKKECNDNVNCEGECIIKDVDILKSKWESLFGKNYECDEYESCRILSDKIKEVNLSEFENKANVKITGYCAEFQKNYYCGGNKGFSVNKGIVRNDLWSWNGKSCPK